MKRIYFWLALAICIFFFFLVGMGYFAKTEAAVDNRPIQVQETQVSLRRNQARITELKPLVEEFNTLKEDNARLVGRLDVFGYSFDWKTMETKKTGVPSPF